MIYPPQTHKYYDVDKKKDGMGGYTQTKTLRGSLRGYLDMLTADDNQAIQNAHIEDSKFVIVIKKTDNAQPWAFIPKKGDAVQDALGRWYVVTFCDDPVGVGHHLEVLLDFLPEGAA